MCASAQGQREREALSHHRDSGDLHGRMNHAASKRYSVCRALSRWPKRSQNAASRA